jgi:hypothetical protein
MAIGATVFLQTQSATAISADLAKKCRDLAMKIYPYTVPLMKAGNAEGPRILALLYSDNDANASINREC